MKKYFEKIFFVASIGVLIVVGLKLADQRNITLIASELQRYRDVNFNFIPYVLMTVLLSFGYGWSVSKIRNRMFGKA